MDIRAAVARIAQAQAQFTLASVALYPTVGFSNDSSRSLSSGTLRSKTGPYFNSVNNRFSLGLNASYEIDFWGRNRDRAEASLQQAEASRFDRDTVALSTAASLTNSYFEVLAAQDRLAIARSNLATAERVLAGIKGAACGRYHKRPRNRPAGNGGGATALLDPAAAAVGRANEEHDRRAAGSNAGKHAYSRRQPQRARCALDPRWPSLRASAQGGRTSQRPRRG